MKKVLVGVVTVALALSLVQVTSAQETEEKKKEKSEKAEKTEKAPEKKVDLIQLKEMKPFSYCALEMTGSYEQHSAAFMKLYGEAGKQGLPMYETPFGIYWNSPGEVPEEELKWEIGFAVPEDKEIQEPLKSKKCEYDLFVSRNYEGAFGFEEMGKAFGEIKIWTKENKYECIGPVIERYTSMPAKNDKGQLSGKVEILIPVKKTEE